MLNFEGFFFLALVLVQQQFVPILLVFWFVLNSVKVKRKQREMSSLDLFELTG